MYRLLTRTGPLVYESGYAWAKMGINVDSVSPTYSVLALGFSSIVMELACKPVKKRI